ncbi:MAG: hypothetical protein R3357_12915 [Burkholderiales bacterium]|nr:hypothetical protein [Burkholderiales bacterium]
MCHDYEWEIRWALAEEARRQAQRIEDEMKRKPKPKAPAEEKPRDVEPAPA